MHNHAAERRLHGPAGKKPMTYKVSRSRLVFVRSRDAEELHGVIPPPERGYTTVHLLSKVSEVYTQRSECYFSFKVENTHISGGEVWGRA